jgi:hypothetical protein
MEVKNKTTLVAAGSSSAAPVKRRPGRPPGSKNKAKVTSVAPGPSAPPPAAPSASSRIFSFYCIAMAQCHEIQCLPLNFTKFMDGQELREVVLREQSGGGTPYEVEVWYDGDGEQYFKGGWSRFAEDHDLHQGFFMTFDYHIGMSKFDVKICGDPAYHCMCSMQVVDITPMKHRLTSITSLRVVQQKHRRSKA